MPSPSSTPANTIRQGLTANSKNAISGACAGILTSLVTCPLDVVKTRFQAQILSLRADKAGIVQPSGELYKGIANSLVRIWSEEGIRGLYRGLGPVMVGYLPTWLDTFYLDEKTDFLGPFIFLFMRSVRIFMRRMVCFLVTLCCGFSLCDDIFCLIGRV